MLRIKRIFAASAFLCLTAVGSSSLQAQMVTNYPVEAPGPLSNPLMGFRTDVSAYSQYPYPTVVRQYIAWNQIENNTNDTVQKIRDFCNAQWKNLPTNNIKVIPRIYIDWDSNMGNEVWPADLQTTNWTSQAFKDRVVRLVGRLGEVWDNDPRVAWVQTGIIGYWGEQESPVGISQDSWAQRLGNAFTNAFHNKKLLVRNLGDWPGYQMGVYWDSFAHPSQSGVRNTIKSYNNQGRYLTQVVEGEVAYNWGETAFDPLYGGEPEITLNNTNYTDNMIDVIRELHASALGWIANYQLDGRYGTDPNIIQANAARMQKEFGYRFHITEFSCPARTEPGASLDVRFKVKNTGSAPFYENWPVAVVLINETTRQMVWKATLPNVDIRTWRPGTNYSSSTRTYQTPAQEQPIAASVPVPAGLAAGQYLIGLSILEPLSRTPGVFFAVTNFFKESQSQPLCRIGIGANAGSQTLTGVLFNDLVNDDKRYYTTNSVGPNYSLTLQSSSQGVISPAPGGGSYVKDTGVQVAATANPGYGFTSWGGALSGFTNNPAIVVMDANKSISANFVQLSTAGTLTTSATNGSITLNPPGGIYNTGTVVTVTASPNIGYAFANWSGDLTGPVNPTTITMNGNKSVAANFVSVPACTLATIAPHGSITLNPPGGIYNTGTVVTVTASPNSGYAFANWSGDLTGPVNPTNITMSGNKIVTANFAISSGPASFRVNCGGAAYTAGDGTVFEADRNYNNSAGNTVTNVSAISGTTDDPLYQTERWGNSFSYSFPLVNGDYEVVLMFAEINFNAANSRVFNVAIEGAQVITNLDIWAKVGRNTAYNQTNVVTVSDGQMNIAFSPVVENPKISAIKVQRIAGQDFHILPPVLQGGQLRLEWVGGGTLQTAANLAGPWSDVLGAVGPYLCPATNSEQFFRAKQ